MPDGTLAVRCKDRRSSRCEPCSRLNQDDAYQLTRAGLVGGKGVPVTVAVHPAVFITLTAPSFGVFSTIRGSGVVMTGVRVVVGIGRRS